MAITNGAVAINGVSDQDLVKILEVKIKHEKVLNFSPQQMQPQQGPAGQTYNNVNLNWSAEGGLKAVHEIISILLKMEERAEKAAAGGLEQ
jgi:hypothetical protein